jgi:hypothetical protein
VTNVDVGACKWTSIVEILATVCGEECATRVLVGQAFTHKPKRNKRNSPIFPNPPRAKNSAWTLYASTETARSEAALYVVRFLYTGCSLSARGTNFGAFQDFQESRWTQNLKDLLRFCQDRKME